MTETVYLHQQNMQELINAIRENNALIRENIRLQNELLVAITETNEKEN